MCRNDDVTVGALVELWERGAKDQVWQLLDRVLASFAGASDSARSETLIRALENDGQALRRADPATPLAAWLGKVIRNVGRERMRETRAVRLLPLDGVASQPARQPPAVPG